MSTEQRETRAGVLAGAVCFLDVRENVVGMSALLWADRLGTYLRVSVVLLVGHHRWGQASAKSPPIEKVGLKASPMYIYKIDINNSA